jgi:hypothetical protein
VFLKIPRREIRREKSGCRQCKTLVWHLCIIIYGRNNGSCLVAGTISESSLTIRMFCSESATITSGLLRFVQFQSWNLLRVPNYRIKPAGPSFLLYRDHRLDELEQLDYLRQLYFQVKGTNFAEFVKKPSSTSLQ